MKRIVYTLISFTFLIVLTSAVNSFRNKTLVLPPDNKVLDLPDQMNDYQVEFPDNVLDFMMGWGVVDTSTINNITNEKATLGRALFYDDRLSGDNSLSCGSCHKQALSFSDDVALSDGIADQVTTRNSMGLNDLGWQLSTQFFWDFRSSSLQDAVLEPIIAAHELGKDIPTLIAKLEAAPEYQSLFQSAFGSSQIDEIRIADALTNFIVSMASFDSKFDQGFNNDFANFTESETRGRHLFEENCGFCHITPHFGSADPFMFFMPGNNGLDSVYTDPGMGGWLDDSFMIGTFKSPSLKNIEVTAPYMHDGRFETLEEVVDFYSEGVQFNETSAFGWMFGEDFSGYEFEEIEKEDLLNFLNTLTDQTFLTDEKWSDPWKTVLSYDDEILQGVNVYPNPVADMVMVEIKNDSGETYMISLYDINGKLLNTFKSSETLIEIPRGKTPAGIYELVASNGKQQKTFKLVYQ